MVRASDTVLYIRDENGEYVPVLAIQGEKGDKGRIGVVPVASATTLGGIKVGAGLSIDENGVLSIQGA